MMAEIKTSLKRSGYLDVEALNRHHNAARDLLRKCASETNPKARGPLLFDAISELGEVRRYYEEASQHADADFNKITGGYRTLPTQEEKDAELRRLRETSIDAFVRSLRIEKVIARIRRIYANNRNFEAVDAAVTST